MSDVGDEKKDEKADWEKELEEFLKPAKADWEEELAELSGGEEVDGLEGIGEEPKEKRGVAQEGRGGVVPSKPWSELSSPEIYSYIEGALSVLKSRTPSDEEKRLAAKLSEILMEIALDPPEDSPEEEEYERVRARAKAIRGPRLI